MFVNHLSSAFCEIKLFCFRGAVKINPFPLRVWVGWRDLYRFSLHCGNGSARTQKERKKRKNSSGFLLLQEKLLKFFFFLHGGNGSLLPDEFFFKSFFFPYEKAPHLSGRKWWAQKIDAFPCYQGILGLEQAFPKYILNFIDEGSLDQFFVLVILVHMLYILHFH